MLVHLAGIGIKDIDTLICPAIKLLNKKRYHTSFCCSGHHYEMHNAFYVSFAGIYMFTIPLPKIFTSAPSTCNEYTGIYLRQEVGYSWENEGDERMLEVQKVNDIFLTWVKQLPTRA